jgi:hypothetical protein
MVTATAGPAPFASRSRGFDLAGLVAVAALAAVLVADLDDLRLARAEAPLAVTASDLADGFRPGVSWFGIHLDDARIGFVRVERRHTRRGREASSHLSLRPVVLGTPLVVESDLDVLLDDALQPVSFTLASTTAGVDVDASGQRRGTTFVVDLTIGAATQRLELPAGEAWTDLGLRTAFLRSQPAPGERREALLLDPLGLRTVTQTIEYVGLETIAVLGQEVSAHHLRHEVAGQVLQVWVNQLGEPLYEEMPLGLVAIRESEAAATYGFGRGAPLPPEATLDLAAVADLVDGLTPHVAAAAP